MRRFALTPALAGEILSYIGSTIMEPGYRFLTLLLRCGGERLGLHWSPVASMRSTRRLQHGKTKGA